MKIYRFLLIFFALMLSARASFSQDSYFIIANFEGAEENDIVYLHSNKNISDSAVIKNKQVQFCLTDMDDECETYFITYRGKARRYDFLLFHNANSNLRVTVDKEFSKVAISGDAYATNQNEFYKGLYSLTELRKSLEKQISETRDSVNMKALRKEASYFDQRFKDYFVNWVLSHNASPFSVAVIRIFIDQSNILKALDTVAASCFDKMLSQAKENNFESYLLQRELAKYSEKYSKVPINTIAPAFIIKDTAGNDIKLEKFKGKWLLIDFWASWCGPCRKNNPLLKEFFLKYHDKGLEVLSISVDTDIEKWKKAIIKDEMNWHQGSDLLGQESGVGKTYQINAVPIYYLLSPEGHIITKSVGGEIYLMEETLRHLLN